MRDGNTEDLQSTPPLAEVQALHGLWTRDPRLCTKTTNHRVCVGKELCVTRRFGSSSKLETYTRLRRSESCGYKAYKKAILQINPFRQTRKQTMDSKVLGTLRLIRRVREDGFRHWKIFRFTMLMPVVETPGGRNVLHQKLVLLFDSTNSTDHFLFVILTEVAVTSLRPNKSKRSLKHSSKQMERF